MCPACQDLRHHDKDNNDGGHDEVEEDDPAEEEEVGGDHGAELGLEALDPPLPGDEVGRVLPQPPQFEFTGFSDVLSMLVLSK